MGLKLYFDKGKEGATTRRTPGARPLFDKGNRLMLITHRTARYTETEEIQLALQGGCSWVQLRMKEGLDDDNVREAVRLCEQVDGRDVVLCVDDHPEIALRQGANACHLGKLDMPVDQAWKLVDANLDPGRVFYVGATANTFEDIRVAVSRGASYIGLGPFRFTGTKKNLSPILGLDGYREIIARCEDSGIDIPIFAIGGITLEDVGALMETGITGLAVSGAIVNEPDPAEATRRFLEEINKY